MTLTREATREREIPSANTSKQGRVRGGQRESDTDKRGNERERERDALRVTKEE